MDIGCGNGVLISQLRATGLDAQGLDPSPWAEAAAKKEGFVIHKELVEADTLPAQSFDGITTTSTFEHIPDPVRHVASLLRLLVPGGVLYMSGMPNYGSASVRAGVSAFHANCPPMHANFLTPRALRQIFDHTEVQPLVAEVQIRTYGIPEAHVFYNRVVLRGRRRSGPADRSRPSNGSGAKRLALAVNYHLGWPFGLGDKLEAVVTRR